jgi:AbiV family abortive infection protein
VRAVIRGSRDLLAGAELLLGAGRWARAYALTVLASEEWAEAYSVLTLSFMSPAAQARVPVREFLEGHRQKNMGALLLRLVDGARPGVAGRVARMADALRAAKAQASAPTPRSSVGSMRISWRTRSCRSRRVSARTRPRTRGPRRPVSGLAE